MAHYCSLSGRSCRSTGTLAPERSSSSSDAFRTLTVAGLVLTSNAVLTLSYSIYRCRAVCGNRLALTCSAIKCANLIARACKPRSQLGLVHLKLKLRHPSTQPHQTCISKEPLLV